MTQVCALVCALDSIFYVYFELYRTTILSHLSWPRAHVRLSAPLPRGHILKSLALASKPQKLPCPRLEDSTIFEPLNLSFAGKRQKSCGKSANNLFLVFSTRDCLKNIFEDLFFRRTLASVSLDLGLGLERVCHWHRNFFMSLASSLVSSTSPSSVARGAGGYSLPPLGVSTKM